MSDTRVSRKAPCPCGSGLKYKHCCGVNAASTASVPKAHHTIPRLHLQHFCETSGAFAGHVWTYSKKGREPRHSRPEETGTQTHFNSFKNEDGTWNTTTETTLALCEGIAAPIYQNLLDGRIPDHRDKAEFAVFLALMHVRTVNARNLSAQIMGQMIQTMLYAHGRIDRVFDQTVADFQQEAGTSLTPEAIADLRRNLLDPSKFRIQVPLEKTLLSLAVAERLAPILEKMHWTLVRPRHGYFVTTDDPVLRRVRSGSFDPRSGDGGFINESAEITFPLSPKRLLALTWNPLPIQFGMMPRDWVDRVNAARIHFANESVFAHIEDNRLAKRVKAAEPAQPRIEFSGFGPRTFGAVEVVRSLKD